MNKKLLLIPIGIGLLAWIIIEMLKTTDTGSKFEMTIPDVAAAPSSSSIKSVTLYLDNSGSMKGYFDFRGLKDGASAQVSVLGTLSNMIDNCYKAYNVHPISYCGATKYTDSNFLSGISDYSIFQGTVTKLDEVIQSICKATNPSGVSIIASDMVLSYGPQALKENQDPDFNKHNLDKLGAAVYNAMVSCQKKGLDALLLQYYSDYNGNYYCNYTENLKQNQFRGKVMKKRPFYLLAIGKKENLVSMMDSHCFNEPQHVYASFPMDDKSKTQPFKVELANKNVGWLIGDPDKPDTPGSISSNSDFGNARSTLMLTCDRFAIPGYVSLNDNQQLVPLWDNGVVENVQEMNDGASSQQQFQVSLKPYNELPSKAEVTITLNSDNSWMERASCDDDTKGNIDGKTWGLATVVGNINKAYNNTETVEPQKIAEIKFNLFK
jgi:hypothetical protein